jgi:hypothetical protein
MEDGGGILGVLGGGMFSLFFLFLFVVLPVVSCWKVFTKAGKPGWAAIVPIYNLVVLLEIVRKPLWWIILILVPIVNIVITLIITLALGECFGKGKGFGVGLFLLPFVFFPILAFGDSNYRP